jgi:hypothetical protein
MPGGVHLLRREPARYTRQRMRPSVRTSLALALALVGVGCTAGEAAGVVEESAAQGSVGVLHVERIADAETGGSTVLSAAFARYRGIDSRAVLGLLGSRSAAELEGCVFVGENEGTVASGEVELLDVGTIEVRVAGTEAHLAPRAFPDLASVLAGVFYAGDATLAEPRPDLDEYAFEAAGSDEIPAFDAVVPAPAAPLDLRIDGSVISAPTALRRESGVDVTWAEADLRDVIEIEVRSHGDVLACASRDDGSFHVDAESLATLAPDGAAELIIRRVRVSPVDVTGLDDAFARIAVSRAALVDLR